MKRPLLALLAAFAVAGSNAQPVQVPVPGHAAPAPTVHWARPDSKAVLVFLPGGSGSFGVARNSNARPTWILADLARSTRLPLDLVFLDSDSALQGHSGTPWDRLAPRREAKHIAHITATIEHYRQRTDKPVFLLGHSNGAVSVAEFLNATPQASSMIRGAIFSGSRDETEVRQKTRLPLLVLHHREDSNRWTTPNGAIALERTLKQTNDGETRLAWVTGGSDVLFGDPTHTGRHMYHGATDEAARLIEDFLAEALK